MVRDYDSAGQGFSARREVDEFRHMEQSSSLPWTSSRCRRLLRPLQSRITALRKLALAEASLGQDVCEDGDTGEALHHQPANKVRVWDNNSILEGRQKRPRRTYSRRSPTSGSTDEYRPASKGPLRPHSGRRQGLNSSASDIPHVSTPILRRVRYDMTTTISSDLPSCEKKGGLCVFPKVGKRGPLESSLNELECARRFFRPSKYQLYEGILHDLDALLRSTMIEDRPVGEKSLLSMCLLKVPQCAAEIEAWEKSRAANHGPVSSIKHMSYSLRVYDDLETLGGSGNGWSHLRIVLRAHAIYLLKEIVMEGLLDVSFIRIIIEHCRATHCPRETVELTVALLYLSCRGPSKDAKPLGSKTGGQLLASLPGLADNPVVKSYLLDNLASLLLSGHLPFDTVSTKPFGFWWNTVASAIVGEKAYSPATRFASAGLALLCAGTFPRRRRRTPELSIRHNATKLTLISVLGTLSAMAMVSQDFGNVTSSRVTGRWSRTQRVVLQVLYQALRLVRGQHASREAASPLLLAIFFTSFPGPAHDSAIQLKAIIETLEGSLGQRQNSGMGVKSGQMLDIAVALTCSVAQCCGRATSRPSSQYFAELCRLVDRLGAPCFARLRADGAFFLAQKTDDLRDLAFAETLTGGLTGKDRSVDAKSCSEEAFSGFRWEEGISEWIAVSPVARRRNGIAPAEVAVPRRSSRRRYGSLDVQRGQSELDMTAEAAEGTRCLMAIAKAASEPDKTQVDWRQARKRQRAEEHDHSSQSGDVQATTDGIDELSMCQENQPWTLSKSRLRSHAIVRLRNQCRRAARSGETVPRMVLTQLRSRVNLTGHGDEDELGL